MTIRQKQHETLYVILTSLAGESDEISRRGYLTPMHLHSYHFFSAHLCKLFRTSNIETVLYCQTVLGCELPSVLLVKRYDKFTERLASVSYTHLTLPTNREV